MYHLLNGKPWVQSADFRIGSRYVRALERCQTARSISTKDSTLGLACRDIHGRYQDARQDLTDLVLHRPNLLLEA